MTETSISVPDPGAAVREWFEKLSVFCSSLDYESARRIFADDVSSFGTHANAVTGLERLQKEQWEQIWPRTSNFRVHMDTVHAGGEGDLGWGMAIWTSLGYTDQSQTFERRGRATVVIARRDGRWVAVHTHFSLFRVPD
jgi:ketosteroid isomerase-like protein